LPDMEERMSKNVVNDLNWLEGELVAQKSRGCAWIVGERLSAADIMLQFR
jgi:glutathione S-transferase